MVGKTRLLSKIRQIIKEHNLSKEKMLKVAENERIKAIFN